MAKTPPPAKRKSERFEMKKSTPSPLRRSPRAKNHSSSSSGSKLSDGKSSTSSLMERRDREVRSSGKSEKQNVVGKKKMDYKSYRALFLKNGKKDNAPVNASEGDSEKLKVSGEGESLRKDERQHLRFQKKVVEGKDKQWTSCSGLSQGKRKRDQQLDVLSTIRELESCEVLKKRRTVVNRNDDSPHLKPGSEGKTSPGCKKGASVTPADIVLHSSTRSTGCENAVTDENYASTSYNVDKNIFEKPESNLFESEERRKLCDGPKSLHFLLKPQMSKLCQILQLSEDMKETVEKLLEYVINNHNVDTEPATILQAFLISLCWAAASFLKQKVNHKESLLLAKQNLNFNCTKDEAYSVYSTLRCLKTTFLLHTGTFKDAESLKFAKLSGKNALKDHSKAKGTQSTTSNLQKVQSEVKDLTMNPEYAAQKDVTTSIKGIRKKFKKKMTKLTEKHKKEKTEFLKNYEEEKGRLEREHKTELAVIQSCFQNNTSMRSDKLKKLEKEMEEHQQCMDNDLERLVAQQQEALYKLMDKEKQLLEKVGSWARIELPNRSSLNKPEPGLECSQTSEQVRVNQDQEEFASLREHGLDKIVPSTTRGVIGLSGTSEGDSDGAVACGGPIRKVMTPPGLHETVSSSNGLHNVVSTNPPSSEEQIHAVTVASSDKVLDSGRLETVSSNDVFKDFAFVNPHSSEQQIPEKASKHEIVSSSNGLHNLESLSSPSSEERIRVVTVSMPPKDVELGVLEPVSLNDGLQNLVLVDLPSSEEQIPENITEHETASLSPDLQSVVSESPPSSQEQFLPVTVTIPDKVVNPEVLETVSSRDDLGNLVSLSPASSEEQTPGKTTEYETVSSSHGLHNLESVDPPSFSEQNPENSTEKENSEFYVVASDSATRVNQQNGVDTAVNGNFSGENTLVNSPAVEPVTALVDAGSAMLHQAHQDKGTLLATSSAVQCGDAQAREMQNTAQPVEIPVSQSVATVAYIHSDCAANNEPVVQVPLPPDSNTPDYNPLELSSVGGIEIQPSIEDHTVSQVAQGPIEYAANLLDLSDQTFLQPLTLHQAVDIPTSGFELLLPDTRAASATYAFNTPRHAAPHMVYGMPLTSYPDPLQYELERLNKETEQNEKSHEDMKQRLKSDCDKEIEAATTEICRKYEIRFLETEAEFQLKKKELDAIRDQVSRNKILSWAFSKYMDLIRVSSASGVQKDGNSFFVQQLHQLSMQQNAQRNYTVAGSLSASPPAGSLATSIALTRNLQATPPAPAPAPATNLHCPVPPMPTVPFLPAQYPSIPARPPHIGSFSSIGIPRGGAEIRAPAPHLQPFRPSTSMSNWQSQSNSPAMSPSLPHIPRLPAPTQQSVSYNRAHHPETAGGLSGLSGLRCNISALELLMNSQSGANPPGIFPPLPNSGLNRDQLHLSSPLLTGGTCINKVHIAGPTDVVCLSDDD